MVYRQRQAGRQASGSTRSRHTTRRAAVCGSERGFLSQPFFFFFFYFFPVSFEPDYLCFLSFSRPPTPTPTPAATKTIASYLFSLFCLFCFLLSLLSTNSSTTTKQDDLRADDQEYKGLRRSRNLTVRRSDVLKITKFEDFRSRKLKQSKTRKLYLIKINSLMNFTFAIYFNEIFFFFNNERREYLFQNRVKKIGRYIKKKSTINSLDSFV